MCFLYFYQNCKVVFKICKNHLKFKSSLKYPSFRSLSPYPFPMEIYQTLVQQYYDISLEFLQCHFNSARQFLNKFKSQYLPEYDHIDILLLYSLFLIVLCYLFSIFRFISKYGIIKPLKTNIFKFAVKWIPFGRRKLQEETDKIEAKFTEDMDKTTYKKQTSIPIGGMKLSTINERLEVWLQKDDKLANSGKISGSKYVDNRDYEKALKDFSKEFAFHNLLHFDIYHACRQMEAEILSMTGDLLNAGKDIYGTTTSGGTESICMAIFTYREWAREVKGITEPEMITAVSAHCAFDKAAHYYGIKLTKVNVDDKTGKIKLGELKSALTRNTICIVGSCPSFPHGIVDPIEEMAEIARKNNIGLHVDCCLGGFLVVFAQSLGLKLPKFDFSLPGVTSISIDHHKYAFAPKGVSAVFYKTKELRHYQYFSTTTWPGGIYLTPNAMGSRSGSPIAGAWFAMVYIGYNGYRDNANLVFSAVEKIKKGIAEYEELEVLGDPMVCVVSFKSRANWLNIYALEQALQTKSWHLAGIQKPPAIHFGITVANAKNANQFLEDLSECMEEIRQNPKKYKGGSVAAIYGTANMIPDEKTVEEVSKVVVDCMLKI